MKSAEMEKVMGELLLTLPPLRAGLSGKISSNYTRPNWFPLLPLAGEGGQRPDEGVFSASIQPQAWEVLKLRHFVLLKRCCELNQHPHPPYRAPSPARGRRGMR